MSEFVQEAVVSHWNILFASKDTQAHSRGKTESNAHSIFFRQYLPLVFFGTDQNTGGCLTSFLHIVEFTICQVYYHYLFRFALVILKFS